MAGISLVGLSGSMIKDAVKEAPGLLVRALTMPLDRQSADLTETVEPPAETMVVVGVLFTLFAQILWVLFLFCRMSSYLYPARLLNSWWKRRL